MANALVAVGLGVATWLTWTDDRGERPVPAPPAGQALFSAKGCIGCHLGPSGVGTTDGVSLVAVRSRVPGMSDAEYIRQSITNPRAVIAPDAPFEMPRLDVSPSELDALVGYLTPPA